MASKRPVAEMTKAKGELKSVVIIFSWFLVYQLRVKDVMIVT